MDKPKKFDDEYSHMDSEELSDSDSILGKSKTIKKTSGPKKPDIPKVEGLTNELAKEYTMLGSMGMEELIPKQY